MQVGWAQIAILDEYVAVDQSTTVFRAVVYNSYGARLFTAQIRSDTIFAKTTKLKAVVVN